jgi:hypothetical protein
LVRLLCAISGRESSIILFPFQLAFLALIATYMIYFVARMLRRSHRTWEAIVSRLSPQFAVGLTLQSSGTGLPGASSAWVAFRDAGVLLELVGYVERNAQEYEVQSMHTLRINAIQIRLSALKTLMSSKSSR